MTFVYPLLLGGMLLAGIPVLLHFLVRQKPTTLPFPAFRFLLQKRRSNTRNLRLRHLLLLLLRIALILLVCLALARPRLVDEQFGIFSREKPVAMILVFDTSSSMEYKSGDMTRLDLAKKRSLELLDQLPEEGRVLILDASDPSSVGREDWLKSLEKARQRIQSLTIRPGSTPVTKALEEAWRRFDDWDRAGDDPVGQSLPRFVCVFSDRTRPSWGSGPAARRQKDDDVKVQTLYFDVGIEDPVDLAILQVETSANRYAFTEGETIELRVPVKATGKQMSNILHVKVAGKTLTQQAFDVDKDEHKTLTLVLPTDFKPGLHQAEITLETSSDMLSFNNGHFLTFRILQKQKILVLADDGKRAQKFAGALEDLLYDVQLKAVTQKSDLAAFDAVFVVGVAAPTDALWNALAAYVEQGRGVCIIPPGDELKRDAYNSPAAQKVMPAAIVRKIENAASSWSLGDSELWHPFMLPFRNWMAQGEYDFLQKPGIATTYWHADPFKEKGVLAVVKFENKLPAVVERISKGKVLLLTTTMDERKPAWNNYDEKLTSFYLAVTLLCAKHLCPERGNEKLNFVFGAQPPLVERTREFPKYLVSSGEFSEEIRFDGKGRWVGDRLPRTGNYALSGTNPEQQKTEVLHKFSMNVAGEECDLSRVPASEIEAALGKDSLVPQDRRTSLADSLRWNEPMELFPWLMILLLFFLAGENLLANRFYGQEGGSSPGEG